MLDIEITTDIKTVTDSLTNIKALKQLSNKTLRPTLIP